MKKRINSVIKRIIQISPFIMIAVMAVLYVTCFRNMTVEQMLNYTPSEPVAAAAVILLLYALKSLSYFFPFMLIAAACGAIFPIYIAIPLNCIGILIFTSIPYAVGRYAEKELVDKLAGKNGKAEKVKQFGTDNQLFSSFFLRIISVLPCDIVSMLLGSMGFSYKKYILGSFLGIFPGIAATTVMGSAITDPLSPEFMISAGVDVFFAVLSVILYKINLNKKKSSQH
ncbi:MAG: TVP38/TMEM64 family protein [Huintestinicola sp.]